MGWICTILYCKSDEWHWYHLLLLIGTLPMTVTSIIWWQEYFTKLFKTEN